MKEQVLCNLMRGHCIMHDVSFGHVMTNQFIFTDSDIEYTYNEWMYGISCGSHLQRNNLWGLKSA